MSKLSKALTITMMLLGAALLPVSAASPATTVKVLSLAKGEVTDYVIVRPANPIPAEQTAVADLASYLKRVTGAEFKIVPEAPAAKPAKAIYVGATAFAAAKGIDPAACAQEEWVVKTFGDDVVISGGKPWGARWGVYDFLESAVGVHMFDTFSEYVPSRATLEVAAPDIRVRPAFRWQVLHSGNLRDSGPLTKKYEDFNRQTRYQSQRSWVVGSPGLCHTFGFYIDPDEYGKDHPEYFAVHKKMDGTLHRNTDAKGGKNYGFDLCLSNPDVRKIVIRKLRGFIKVDREKAAKEGNAPPLIYEIQQNDGLPGHGPDGNGCLCPECRKIVEREGAESGLYIDFINAVADAVKDNYPDILIQTFAYNHTVKAPKQIRPRDNVMIMWCDYIPSDWFRPLTHEVNKPQRELLESWARISKNMAVYDYWNVLQEHTPGFYIPSSSISCVKSDLEYFQKNNVKRIWIGSFPDFRPNDYFTDDEVHNFYALKVWLGCKLLLDPGADEKKLLDTFFTGYYGPAAGKMREFMDYIERRQNAYPGKLLHTVKREDFYKTYLDLEFFRAVEGMLDAAEAAVAKDPLRLARVKRERIPVDSALLHLEPSLRKAYSAQGEAYPFDRKRVLARYAANWAVFLENFVPAANRENARAFVEKRLDYLRSMPMLTAESIRHRAAPVADSALKIDGVLNESAWKNAAPFYLTPLNKLETLKTKTAVRTLWSKEMLYIAFECFDDRMSDMKFEQRPKDHPDTWRDSAVEVFLNPSGDRRTYYQIIVNPAGSQVDTGYETREYKLNPDSSWDCNAKVAVKSNADSWVVEMAVPFKAIGFEPKPGATIVANVGRSRHLKSDAAASQLTAWSPLLIRGFHDLERFGTLVLANGNDEPFASFEGPQDMPVLSLRSGCLVKVSQEKERVSDGQSSLRVEFPPTKGKVDVGVSIGRSELTDWSGFKSLVADIFYDGEWDYWQWSFNARLDGDNKQLYYQGVLGSPRLKSACWNKNVVICDLAKAAEKVDLKHVKNFYLYIHSSPERTEPIVLFLDNIRLVRKTGGDK
jgi:hypothetical protein